MNGNASTTSLDRAARITARPLTKLSERNYKALFVAFMNVGFTTFILPSSILRTAMSFSNVYVIILDPAVLLKIQIWACGRLIMEPFILAQSQS